MEPVQRPIAVIDLGTAFAKVVLLYPGAWGTWIVAGSAIQAYHPTRAPSDGPFAAALDAADEAMLRALRRGMHLGGRTARPDACLITVASPPARLHTVGQDSARAEPAEPITRVENRALSATLEWAAVGDLAPSAAPAFWLGEFARSTSVEGRPTAGLVGFRGASVQMDLGVASMSGLEATHLREWAATRGMNATLLPEPLAHDLVLRRWPNCLTLDVGTTHTSVSYLMETGRRASMKVPLGGRQFTTHLALSSQVSPDRAESLKTAYGTGSIAEEYRPVIANAMARAMSTWGRSFAGKLVEERSPLPGYWLAWGGGATLPEMDLLPQLCSGDSIGRFERYPVLRRLPIARFCCHLSIGPDPTSLSHANALLLGDWWLGVQWSPGERRRRVRLAQAAQEAGYEVDPQWLMS